jgi:hypothetical protein
VNTGSKSTFSKGGYRSNVALWFAELGSLERTGKTGHAIGGLGFLYAKMARKSAERAPVNLQPLP